MARTTTITLVLAMMTRAVGAAKPKVAFLAVSMQPEKIARTLVGVQDEWKAQVALFASCDTGGIVDSITSKDDGDLLLVDCRRAPIAFAKSCNTVVQALTKGSDGDRDSVNEYMQDVCQHSEILQGWRQSSCQHLANSISGAMSDDAYSNRVALGKTSKVCTGLWSEFVAEEQTQRDGERKQAAAKDADEAKRKAEAKAKAEEDAKKRADDEAKAEEEAKEAAKARNEAKAKAEKAAAKARAEAKVKADEEAKAKVAKLAKKTSQDDTVAATFNRMFKDEAQKAQKAKHTVKVQTPSRVNVSAKRTVNTTAPKRVKTSAKRTVNATAPKRVK